MALMGNKGLVAVLIAALALVSNPSAAQISSPAPLTQDGNMLSLKAMGHDFIMPLPDWLTPAERLSGNALGRLETHYVSDETQALLEIYPKGETQALWKTLYGARITLEPGRPLTDYRKAIIFGYSRTCKPELTGFFQFQPDQGDKVATLGFVCGAYLDNLKGYAGQGEVMITTFRKTDKGVAILYQEWRGPAFDPSTPSTWPVSAETVQSRAAQLEAEATLVATP